MSTSIRSESFKNLAVLTNRSALSRLLQGLRGLFIITSLSPSLLGEYTIYLLYFFYFSCLELGISHGLERDLPHCRGQNDDQGYRRVANNGWSSYFCISLLASAGLAVVSFIVFQQWILALLLAGYLLADKIYRAYNTNARIFFEYKTSGIAELIHVAVSFFLISLYLPRYGIYSIFACFIVGFILGTVYLAFFCRLNFQWRFRVRKAFEYINRTFSLTIMFYSMAIFQQVSLTVVALIWDKTTLGYYAFAFRIFQICLAIFPYPIRQVMRTRMYFHLAKTQKEGADFKGLVSPLLIYSLITSIFWLATYWWAPFVINRFAPEYGSSIFVLNILVFSLVPIGISTVCSDYLSSLVFNKMVLVNYYWIIGIFIQVFVIFSAHLMYSDIFNFVPVIYLCSTMFIYFCVIRYIFSAQNIKTGSLSSMACLILPLAIALFSVLLIKIFFHVGPSLDVLSNIRYSAISSISIMALAYWFVWFNNKYKMHF